MAIDDAALPVGTLIEFAHSVLAEQREIVHDFLELFTRPDLFLLADLWTPRHGNGMLPFSPFLRLCF